MSRRIAAHFRPLSVLPEGGPGTVHEAEDTRLGRRVALRLVSSGDADEATSTAILEAARAVASLNHPGIATIYEAGRDEEGRVYIASELVEGRPLTEVIAEGPLPADRACRLLDGLAAALDHAHARGVVHGHLTPASVVVTAEGNPRVTDLGLALEPAGASVAYLAPERLTGHVADELTDLWALGAIFHEMLTGRRAFPGGPAPTAGQPHPAGATDPRLGALQQPLLDRLLATRRERRFPSAAAVRVAIQQLDPELLRPPRRRRRSLLLAAAVAVAVLAAWYGGRSMRPEPRVVPSVAILPLRTVSGDEDLRDLAAGFSGEVIRTLAQVADLRVIAQSSTRNLDDTVLSLVQIADTLGVENVVCGTLRQVGDRLQLTAELRDARSDRLLWSNSYDAEQSGALILQASVARAVAEQVKGKLDPQEQAMLTQTASIDPEAYRAYLKGVAQLETWGLMGVWWRAEDLLATAVTLEPDFAPAWAELARTYCWLRWFHPEKPGWMLESTHPAIVGALENQAAMARALGLSPEAWYPQLARAAADRALALDPDLAAAHTVEGMLAWMFDQDWNAAEQSFQRALRFAPGNSFVRRQYADFLMVDGRCDQAATEARQAIQLSPLSLAAQREHAILLMNCRRFDEADAAVAAALPTYAGNRDVYIFWVFRMHMAIWQDRPDDVAAYADSVTAHTTTGRLAAPGLWYLGRRDEAWELMGGRKDYQPSATSAYLLMLEDRRQEALDLIERWAEESPAYGMVTMLDPYFDPLHDDPRWRAVAESLQMRRYLQ